MARVAFTRHLHRFFPALGESGPVQVDSASVAELIAELEARYPGLAGYLCDDAGALRRHVNIFVNGAPVRDRQTLGDALDEASSVHIMQALSGG